MVANKSSLDDIMRESYKEFKGYLKRVGIEIKDVKLRVLKSQDLSKLSYMIETYDINKLKQELNTIDKSLLEKISNDDDIYIINKENLREFYIGEIYLLGRIFNTDDIKKLNKKILKYIYHIKNEKSEEVEEVIIPEIKEVYIIKDILEKGIDEILNRLSPINIDGPFIIRLGWPLFGVVSVPLYTDGENIEKDVLKVFAANTIIYGMEYFIFDRKKLANPELSISALQYITYVDMYNLLKYPKTYKIIKENIKNCKKYINNLIKFVDYTDRNFSKLLPKDLFNVLGIVSYDLGECYANIIIDRNKNLNIKDVVEEVKNLSTLDALNKIAYYKFKR
jgi:hypothetical protein